MSTILLFLLKPMLVVFAGLTVGFGLNLFFQLRKTEKIINELVEFSKERPGDLHKLRIIRGEARRLRWWEVQGFVVFALLAIIYFFLAYVIGFIFSTQ